MRMVKEYSVLHEISLDERQLQIDHCKLQIDPSPPQKAVWKPISGLGEVNLKFIICNLQFEIS